MVRFKNLERYHALVNEKDRLERSKLNKIAKFRGEEEFLYRYKRGYFKAQKYVENANASIDRGNLDPKYLRILESKVKEQQYIMDMIDKEVSEIKRQLASEYNEKIAALIPKIEELEDLAEKESIERDAYLEKKEEEKCKRAEERRKIREAEARERAIRNMEEQKRRVPSQVELFCAEVADGSKMYDAFKLTITDYMMRTADSYSYASHRIQYKKECENLRDAYESGEYARWIRFCKNTINGEWPGYFYKPEWLDNIVNDNIVKVFGKEFDRANILIIHSVLKAPHTPWDGDFAPFSSFNPAYTGICGKYANCYEIDPEYQETENALFNRMLEETINHYGSIGCQRI